MRITFAVAEAQIDVDVTLRADQPVRAVVTALADGPVAPQVGLLVDGRFVAPDTLVADAGLREGAVVELATGGGDHRPSSGSVELRVVGGLCGGARHLLGPGAHVVGR